MTMADSVASFFLRIVEFSLQCFSNSFHFASECFWLFPWRYRRSLILLTSCFPYFYHLLVYIQFHVVLETTIFNLHTCYMLFLFHWSLRFLDFFSYSVHNRRIYGNMYIFIASTILSCSHSNGVQEDFRSGTLLRSCFFVSGRSRTLFS